AMIFRSGWRATAKASSPKLKKSVLTLPPVPKLVSRLPSGLYRASAKSSDVLGLKETPARMIFPSGCMAMAEAPSVLPKKLVVTFPPLPSVGSRPPAAAATPTAVGCWAPPPTQSHSTPPTPTNICNRGLRVLGLDRQRERVEHFIRIVLHCFPTSVR